jgi:hypothetical protein
MMETGSVQIIINHRLCQTEGSVLFVYVYKQSGMGNVKFTRIYVTARKISHHQA